MAKVRRNGRNGWWLCLLVGGFVFSACASKKIQEFPSSTDTQEVKLSQKLLQAGKTSKDTALLVEQLCGLEAESLHANLKTDAQKHAFWINVYNALILIKLTQDSSLYKNRGDFFSKERLCIGGRKYSFDDIEHGILRKGTYKYSLGLFKNPFQENHTEKLEVENMDYRIHFALNCGAESCPPIRIYSAENLEEELNANSSRYLNQQVSISNGNIYFPKVINWFSGDFGERSEKKDILKRFNLWKDDYASYGIRYNEYSWELDLDNFSPEFEAEPAP